MDIRNDGPAAAPASGKHTASTLTDCLRSRIARGELPLGARIMDKDLAAEFGVSRTPIREALLRLKNEGLVVIKAQSGTYVFNPGDQDIAQICAARAVLEAGALRLLASQEQAGWLPELHRLVARSAEAVAASDARAFDELDCRFHETIVASVGNVYLSRAYESISAQLRALRQKMPRSDARMRNALEQHRRILDHASLGETVRAVDELEAHVGNVAALLRQSGDHP